MRLIKFLPAILVFFIVITVGLFYFLTKSSQKIIVIPTSSPVSSGYNTSTNFSMENAPSESLKGQIISMSGDVFLQDRVATNSSPLFSQNVPVQQGENYSTGENGKLIIIFKDALQLTLFKNSEVDIIQTLPNNIVLSQTDGISEYESSNSAQVTIRTSYLLTNFNGKVKIERNTNKSTVIINVESGTATFAYNDKKLLTHLIKAKAGQTYVFNYGTRKGVLK